MPPVLGWVAVTGEVAHDALLLFLIIFAWTPPHFWSLALYRRDDYAKAGVRRQWFSPGHTVLFAECGQYIDQLSPSALATGITASEFTRFGFGAVQEIDAAAPCRAVAVHAPGVTVEECNRVRGVQSVGLETMCRDAFFK